METVLSDHPSLPSQACLLCSADAAVLYRCFSLQCSKSLPQLPGCMFSGPGAVLVWSDPFHMVVPVFIPGVWCGVVWGGVGWSGVVAVLTARVSSAHQHAQCAASILWGACNSPFLVVIDKM